MPASSFNLIRISHGCHNKYIHVVLNNAFRYLTESAATTESRAAATTNLNNEKGEHPSTRVKLMACGPNAAQVILFFNLIN